MTRIIGLKRNNQINKRWQNRVIRLPGFIVITKSAEWITTTLIAICSLSIVIMLLFNPVAWSAMTVMLLTVLLTLHSSLQHEVLHGHPFRRQWLNEVLVSVPFGLFIPYQRFKDTHLQHHINENLTDPHEDPETNYLDPAIWGKLPNLFQCLLRINNTLAGRMVIGPILSLVRFYRSDIKAMLQGDYRISTAYVQHLAGLVPLLFIVEAAGAMKFSLYLLSAYCALSVLSVRTFLEHQANGSVPHRSVIIEDRGIFALLFLYNNFHYVHHAFPKAPWYRLPSLYFARRDSHLSQNGGYVYKNYWQIFSLYLFKSKDSVAHPLMPTK